MSRSIRPALAAALLIAGWSSALAQPTEHPSDPNARPGPLASGSRPIAPPIPLPLPNVPPVPQSRANTTAQPSRPLTYYPLTPAGAVAPPPVPTLPPVPAPAVTAPPAAPPPAPAYFPTLPTVTPPPPAKPLAFEPYWDNGLYFRTPDRSFVAHLGGVLQYDAAWYTGGWGVQRLPGGVGPFSDGVNARRLRILFDGTWYDDFEYKIDVEFSNGFYPAGLSAPASAATVSNSPAILDAYVTVKNVPWLGNVRVGNQKEWFSLEHLESARALQFMERSYLFDTSQPSAFNNGRSPGLSAFRTWANDSLFTAVGVYKNDNDTLGYGVGDGEYAVTGRVAALPVWMPERQTYWHVGGAMSLRDPVNDQVRLRARNGVRNAPVPLLNVIADTGNITASSQTLFNLETAYASGPLTASGEFTTNRIDGASQNGNSLGTLAFHGFYAQASYFLTGEHREWNPKAGVYKRVTPLNRFDPKHGTWGAWEANARVSYLDLDEGAVRGGRLRNVTLGLTWYMTANLRWQANYDYLYRDGGVNRDAKGGIHSLGTRLSLDF